MLTNATVKAARPGSRPYKMADAGGLYLFVRPNGSKCLRMKYRFGGKEKLLTFGTWPEIDLGEARERRDRARASIDRGVDPSTLPRAGSARDERVTFEILARRWHERRRARWSAVHAADVLASLERDVFPAIGARELADVDASTLLELLLEIEKRGCVETARRVRERISAIFRFGIPQKLVAADPAALIVDELSPRPLQRPQPALLELDQARALLAAAEQAPGPVIVRLASRFLALTAVRMAALRGARWGEFEDLNGDAPLWRIPAERMKLTKIKKGDSGADHIVPLSWQAAQILRLVGLTTGAVGDDDIVFPGRGAGRPIGEGAIGALYVAAGFGGQHVPHGWRATFSTILNERFPGDQQLIDQALAHAGKKGKVEAAYNRAQHLDRLRILFQCWADLLEPPGTAAAGA